MVNSSEDPSNLQQNKDTFRQQKLRKKKLQQQTGNSKTASKQTNT